MWKKITGLISTVLLLVLVGLLIRTEHLFLSHETAVSHALNTLVEKNGQRLPTQVTDMTMRDDVKYPILYQGVSRWEARNIELANSQPFIQTIIDDDPVYSLNADIHIIRADGLGARLSWESWQYGFVIGSIVFSYGEGPPGQITAVSLDLSQ